jgi:hypothetical protein
MTFCEPRPYRALGYKSRNRRRSARPRRPIIDLSPAFERLESRCVMSGTPPFGVGAVDLPINPTVNSHGGLTGPGAHDLYRVRVDGNGLLVAQVHASGTDTILSLLDGQGKVLIQSEATSPRIPDNRIAQHLPAGTYYLDVASRAGAGTFDLSTTFNRASVPHQALPGGSGMLSLTAANLTADHIPAVIVPDYYHSQILVNLGVGDGTFKPPVAIPVGFGPAFILAGDFTGNGITDLAVADQGSNDVVILLGNGDGTFRPGAVVPTLGKPTGLVAGDFNGDGHLDFAVADQATDSVEVFRGNGDGTFTRSDRIDGMADPSSLVAGDFYGNGHLDLAVASPVKGVVVVLGGRGDGTFVERQELSVGIGCSTVIAADFVGDGRLDLAAASPTNGTVSVFRNYNGYFLSPLRLTGFKSPSGLVAADFSGHGRLDLAVSDFGSNEVALFPGNGDGTFGPRMILQAGSGPVAVAAADLNGDGRPELVTADGNSSTVTVLMNHGNATFETPPPVPPAVNPSHVVTADLTGNGILDLVVAEDARNDIAVLLGRGDGTFRDPIRIPVGTGPFSLVLGDFNGDHIPDIAVVNDASNDVSVLLGNGDGTFRPGQTLAADEKPVAIKTADLNGDGHLDLVVVNGNSDDVSVYRGRGDGTFAGQVLLRLPAGSHPTDVAIGDFKGDGRLGIAVTDSGLDQVTVFLGVGGMEFAAAMNFAAGPVPQAIAAADLNGDGHQDLLIADSPQGVPSAVSVLFGQGDGTFRAPVPYSVGEAPFSVVIADVNGDGHPDALTSNIGTNTVSLLLGRGDGTFAPAVSIPTGGTPLGLALGDFTGGGHLDVVTTNYLSNDLTVALGQGDGSFKSPQTIPLTLAKLPTVVADLEGSGLPHVVVANPDQGTLTVQVSQGDGTLKVGATIQVGGRPSGMVVGDFNGDGRVDLAVSDAQNGDVLILLGLGNSTFQDPVRYHVGRSAVSLVAGHLAGDGHLDLAVADPVSNTVTILFGKGDGTFRLGPSLAVGVEPVALVAADLTGSGRTDLLTADRTGHEVTFLFNAGGGKFFRSAFPTGVSAPSALLVTDLDGDGRVDIVAADVANNLVFVLWGKGGGVFTPPQPFATGQGPDTLVAADLDATNDGSHDLIVGNSGSHDLTIFRGWGNHAYLHRYTVGVNGAPAGLVAADLNNDRLPDLVIANAITGAVEVYLASGDGKFSPPELTVPLPGLAPLVAHDGGVLAIDDGGQILRRDPVPGAPGELGTAQNLSIGTGLFTRQMIGVKTVVGWSRVSVVANQPYLILTHPTDAGLEVSYIGLPPVGIYTRVAAGDLFREGRDSLVVLDHGSDQVLIFRQDATGHFHQYGNPIRVGIGPTDVTIAQLAPNELPDVVVANGASGDISLITRGPGGSFLPDIRIAAGLSPASTLLLPEGLTRTSADKPVGVVAGYFDKDGGMDVVVVDRGTDRISVLKGTSNGGLSNPTARSTYTTGLAPTQVVAARLGRNGKLDLAVLNEGSHDISIFMNDGQWGFVTMARVDAGDNPTGMAVHDVNGDGVADLLVTNGHGDLLILIGNGDGTFKPYQRADRQVSLAVGDLTGTGKNDFVISSNAQDRITATSGFNQGRSDGIQAPGPVAIADMNGDGMPDLVVTNTGGNEVFVYVGLGHGRFAPPQRFFTGQAPKGLTVADVTGSGLLDLVVANSGSNDVTILLGKMGPNGWTMVNGPRLRTGLRPVSTTVAHLPGEAYADILVVNQDSNTVSLLRGLGSGFFDDTNPRTFAAGTAPVQAFVGRFGPTTGPGLVVLNSLSNDMTYYPQINAPTSIVIPTGGLNPVAGVMGNFNHSTYSDLAIANNGDSLITLFYGGVHGLAFAESVSLGNSAHPTGIVVTTTAGGGVQFYAGAEGQGRAIPIVFSPLVVPAAPAPAATTGGLPTSTGGVGFSTAGIVASAGFNAFLNGEGASGSAQQSQSTSQASTQSSGTISSSSQGALAVAIFSQATQPLLSPSMRSLSWLIDNLVQIGQSQTADILPLGNQEMAAVAVILAVSSTSVPSDTQGAPSPAGPNGPGASAAFLVQDHDATPPPSPLDRFIINLEASFAELPRDPLGRAPRSDDFGADWVWHRRASDASETPVSFRQSSGAVADTADTAAPPTIPGGHSRGPQVDAAVFAGFAKEGNVDDPLGSSGPGAGDEPVLIPRMASLAVVAVVSTAVVAWKGFERRILGRLQKWTRLGGRPAPTKERKREPRVVSNSSLRPRSSHDLPPWIQSPVSLKPRRSSTDRRLATTFFRKRSHG